MKKIFLIVLLLMGVAQAQINHPLVKSADTIGLALVPMDTMGRSGNLTNAITCNIDSVTVWVKNMGSDALTYSKILPNLAAIFASSLSGGIQIDTTLYRGVMYWYARAIVDTLNGNSTSGYFTGQVAFWWQGEPSYGSFNFYNGSNNLGDLGTMMAKVDTLYKYLFTTNRMVYLDNLNKMKFSGTAPNDTLLKTWVGTNNDKTGYSLTQGFPTNFSSLAITGAGAVTAGTVGDKTGYSLTQGFPSNFSSMSINGSGYVTTTHSFPTNFSALSITAGGKVAVATNDDKAGYTASTVTDKTGYSLTQGFPTNFSSLSINGSGFVTVVTNNDKTGYTASTVSDKTGYSLTQSFPSNFSSMRIGSTGYVSPNWGDVGNPTTNVGLSGTTVGDITTKTGFSLSAAGIDAFYDELKAGHTTNGTYGKYIDTTISSRATTSGGGSSNDSLQIRRWVWDPDSTHYVGNNYGRNIDNASTTGGMTLAQFIAYLNSDTCLILDSNNIVDGSAQAVKLSFIAVVDTGNRLRIFPDSSVLLHDTTHIGAKLNAGNWSNTFAPTRALTSLTGFSLATTGLNGVTQASGSVIFSNTSIATVGAATLVNSIADSVKNNTVDKIWDELKSGHTVTGSFGKQIDSLLRVAYTAESTVLASVGALPAGQGTLHAKLGTYSGASGDNNNVKDDIDNVTAGEGGTADWTSDERKYIRFALGIPGDTLQAIGSWGRLYSIYSHVDPLNYDASDYVNSHPMTNVTVGTNNDKTGYTASTVSDKTGYSLAASQTFSTTGSVGSTGSITSPVTLYSNADITAIREQTDKIHFSGDSTLATGGAGGGMASLPDSFWTKIEKLGLKPAYWTHADSIAYQGVAAGVTIRGLLDSLDYYHYISTGSGFNACTLYVKETTDSTAVGSVQVMIMPLGGGLISGHAYTDISGRAIFQLNNGSYEVYKIRAGYAFHNQPDTIALMGTETDTLWGTLQIPAVAPAGMVTIAFHVTATNGDTLAKTKLEWQLVSSTGASLPDSTNPRAGNGLAAVTLSKQLKSITSNNSYFTIPLYPNVDIEPDSTKYYFRITYPNGTIGQIKAVTVPDTTAYNPFGQ